MKSTFIVACVALLLAVALPAAALQLGQIEVKSALNQPLVAAIPLHPKNLSELDGLTVSLAPAADFQRAGLTLTPTDQSLRFHVTADNNGQQLILVTSSQPVSDPYLDFLVEINTHEGRQIREFVVLLNPVIGAPAPAVMPAPARAEAPTAPTPGVTPSASAPPMPAAGAVPSLPAPPPQAQPAPARGSVAVATGDTLYRIAQQARAGSGATLNQMMLALKAANPDAFFRNNINDLKAGSILRIPGRDALDKVSVAAANAEVHQQYVEWRAAKPHPATVLAGAAAEAAANTAPRPTSAARQSDHLTLAPPTAGAAGGTANRAGVAGGTGSETVAGLRRQLQAGRDSLVSVEQSNDDLEARVQSLKDIADKSDKLLSLKDATIAELQHKLARLPGARAPAGPAVKAAAKAAPATAAPWYERPLAWIIAGIVVVLLVLTGLLWQRRRPQGMAPAGPHGPLPDPDDLATDPREPPDPVADDLYARLAADPGDLAAHLGLCRLYFQRGDAQRFAEAAEGARETVGDHPGPEWQEIETMGRQLVPTHPLFAPAAEPAVDPYGLAALHAPAVATEGPREDDASLDVPTADALVPPPAESDAATWLPAAPVPPAAPAVPPSADDGYAAMLAADPVDTKLDLARAYLDMGDPVGARAMLEEVLEEGSQPQKDEATRLMAEAVG